jgi:hypothetical protein
MEFFMRWKSFLFTSVILGVLSALSACTRQSSFAPFEEEPKKKSISGLSNNPNGTVDGGGGGNKICGRPIEAFRKDLDELSEYKKYIDPIMQYFSSPAYDGCNNCQIHNFAMGAHISYAVLKKAWYFVPCSLEPLAKEKIGSVYETEQVALQTFDEIWFDQEKFNALNEKDRALMIFHEIIMSIKILNFDSSIKQCEVTAPGVGFCNDIHNIPRKNLNSLSTTDYKEVRMVTNELFNNYLNYDPLIQESKTTPESQYSSNELLRKNNFSNSYHIWSRKNSDSPTYSSSQLIRALTQTLLSQDMPSFTKHQSINKNELIASQKCSLDFHYNETDKKINLNFKTHSFDNKMIAFELKKEFSLESDRVLKGHYIDSLRNGQLESIKEFSLPLEFVDQIDSQLKLGERNIRVFLQFSNNDLLQYWELMESVCISETAGKCNGTISVNDSKISRICTKVEKINLDFRHLH